MASRETIIDPNIPLEQQVPLGVLTGSFRLKILSNPTTGDMTGLDPQVRQSDPLVNVDLPSMLTELNRRVENMEVHEITELDNFVKSTIGEVSHLGRPVVLGIYELGKAVARQMAYHYGHELQQGYD